MRTCYQVFCKIPKICSKVHLVNTSDYLPRVHLLLPVVVVPQHHHQLGHLLPEERCVGGAWGRGCYL